MKKIKESNIAVIGGGISGLSAAFFLQKAGAKVTVYEREGKLKQQGLGFLIMPNGFRVMSRMGLAPKLQEEGTPIFKTVLIDEKGKVNTIQSMNSCYAITRPSCIGLLEESIGTENIQYEKKIIDFHENSGIVDQLEFSDGTMVKPDMIIASDGINSKTRNFLFPDHHTKVVKEKEIVSIIHSPLLSKMLKHTFVKLRCPEKGFNMGIIPVGKDELVWYIQINTTLVDAPGKNPVEIYDFCSQLAPSLPGLFKRALDVTNYSNAYVWEMQAMELLPSFHKKGILLTGDAAHPLLSFTSQGASSALDDAWYFNEVIQAGYSSNEELFSTFYNGRKKVIQQYLSDGKILLDQFLFPGKYSTVDLPYCKP
jgi:2-polyprenyl-6-methoxyphenol hydroxylase-like FAD-dependent oxidoreductase